MLLLRLGALGDVVRTTACLPALRRAYPEALLAWLVEEPAAGALRSRPELDRVLVFPRRALVAALAAGQPGRALGLLRAFLGELRALRFELVIDFHSIARSALLARASGAPRRVALAPPHGRELSWLLASQRVRLAPGRRSRFARNRGLLAGIGIAAPEAAELPWSFPEPAGPRSGAVLHPGSSGGAAHKRYPPERHGAVARGLADRLGLDVEVVHGPGERSLAEAVVAASGGRARLAPATADVDGLARRLRGARVFVGSDSGPLHLASLVGTPVVQLLGPTDPIENEPWSGTAWRRVSVPLPCRPCRRGCAAVECMRGIEPEAVVAAVEELLAAEAPA